MTEKRTIIIITRLIRVAVHRAPAPVGDAIAADPVHKCFHCGRVIGRWKKNELSSGDISIVGLARIRCQHCRRFQTIRPG